MSDERNFVPFEPIEHTADLALVARGRTLPELFEHAALGMLHFLYDPAEVVPTETESFDLSGIDLEELLVTWLQELLYRHEVRRWRVHALRVERLIPPGEGTPAFLQASADGEGWDPARPRAAVEIKAATYHGIEITREPSRSGVELYRVRLVFDI
jgi:SHS2 domain-containing protein